MKCWLEKVSYVVEHIRLSLQSVFPHLGRGGQSALRFARLRMEKRHNYVRKVAETAVQLFVSNDKVNVAGMVLAGSADFKTELSQSDMFDPVSLCLVSLNALLTNLFILPVMLITNEHAHLSIKVPTLDSFFFLFK